MAFIFGVWGGSVREIRALPPTGGWLPHGSVFNPLSFPTLRVCFIIVGGVEGGYMVCGIYVSGPVRKDPSPLVR